MNGGGPGSGIWKSIDGGDTWTRLSSGLPAGPLGRIGLDTYRKNGNIVYASIEARDRRAVAVAEARSIRKPVIRRQRKAAAVVVAAVVVDAAARAAPRMPARAVSIARTTPARRGAR